MKVGIGRQKDNNNDANYKDPVCTYACMPKADMILQLAEA